ncbi:MAG: NHLP family bacteriocin export ABC transporter peptidase/permease/ATPase subunit [Xenococcaceae cyanobacterium]
MVSTNFSSITSSITSIQPWQYLQQLLRNSKTRAKTPTIIQMEAVECGAASLAIMLGYFGRIVPLSELRRTCGVSRDGSNASNVLKASRKYGMEAKGLKKNIEQLKNIKPPYIVFWNFNHFLVVEGFAKDGVYLNDPASGPRKASFQEFDEAYTGVALVMEPGSEFSKGGRKPSLFSALKVRLQSAPGALIYAAIAGLMLTFVGMIVPVFNQIFVDEILVDKREQWLRPLLIAMAIAAIAQGALTLLRLRYLRRLKIKLSVGMSSNFLWHILRLPMSFYAQRFAGEISNRTKLNDEIAEVLSGKLATTAIDSLTVVFYALLMVQYDWILTLLVVCFAAINIFTLQWISRQRVDANQKLMQDYGKAAGTSISGLQSIETLKASGLESDFFAKWSGYYTKAANSMQDMGVTNQAISILPVLLSSLSSTFLLIVGGWRIMSGDLSIGMFVAFQGLMQNFQEPITNLVGFGGELQELEGKLTRLDDVLQNSIDPELQARKVDGLTYYAHARTSVISRLQGYVELRDLTYGYSPLDPPLIKNFNLSIKPGQRVALVGGSGSGKSTIAKLINGIFQIWSGEIRFDGQPKQIIPHQILTNSLTTIEQDILLFEGSVRDNLTLWDTTVSDRDLKQACQDAAIDEIIQSMPGGYNAELREGATNLSGGQRQRLEIARALVNNPSILIMDEATSALDAETEKIIDRNIRRRGCSCIVVAHRLSTIRDCDQIIVLERGKVVQQGTHDELWQQEGVYARLIGSEGGAL